MTLVIMAAGMGSRYGGLKQIDPIGPNGEFIIDYSIYDAIQAGFDHVVFIIKEENYDLFRDTVGKRIENKIKVSYVFQDIQDIPAGYSVPEGRVKPWGTGHAVFSCKDVVKDNFALINADDFYGREAFQLLASFLSGSIDALLPYHFCMIGYQLKNTISENGSVARGVCVVDSDQKLVDIHERTKVERRNQKIQYFEDGQWNLLADDAIVSMNCFGFSPKIFSYMKDDMVTFFEKNKDRLEECEYYIPSVVKNFMDRNICDMAVLNTTAKWYGVTYLADKQTVSDAIARMIAEGIYPSSLWKETVPNRNG